LRKKRYLAETGVYDIVGPAAAPSLGRKNSYLRRGGRYFYTDKKPGPAWRTAGRLRQRRSHRISFVTSAMAM
jgi:hypothetical protein